MRVVRVELVVFIIVALVLVISCTKARAKKIADEHLLQKVEVVAEKAGDEFISSYIELIDDISNNFKHMLFH